MDEICATSGLGTGIAIWRSVPVPSFLLDDGLSVPDFGQQLSIGLVPLVNGFKVLLNEARGLFLF